MGRMTSNAPVTCFSEPVPDERRNPASQETVDLIGSAYAAVEQFQMSVAFAKGRLHGSV